MNADERQLRSALEHFNSVTDNLIQAYQLLEAQVAELNVKLQVANDELVAKSAANEQLAAKLSTLLQVMPAGVVELDEQGRIVALNEAVQAWLPSLRPGDDWCLADHFHDSGSDGVYAGKQGGQFFTVLACPLPDAGSFLMLVDVSKLHHLHQQLAQQERLAVMGRMGRRWRTRSARRWPPHCCMRPTCSETICLRTGVPVLLARWSTDSRRWKRWCRTCCALSASALPMAVVKCSRCHRC